LRSIFNDIKGSKKSKAQFIPCRQHPSHIAKCINSIEIYFNPNKTSSKNINLTLEWVLWINTHNNGQQQNLGIIGFQLPKGKNPSKRVAL